MISFLAYWVHRIDPFVVKFPEGFFVEGIRWYGVAYLAAFILGGVLLHFYKRMDKVDWDFDQQTNLLTALIIGVLVGGRLGYMLMYSFEGFAKDPLMFFKITQGGMASHGGMLGVIIACYWFSKKSHTPFLRVMDVVATLAPAGILLGRIANFINSELVGKITDVPWAVIFPNTAPWLPIDMIPPRHPVQLYEAFLEGFLLLIYTQVRLHKLGKKTQGKIAGEVLILYGIFRIFVEVFRQPDAPLIWGLSRGQFFSIFLILIGAFILQFSRKRGTL
jgi:phosphatidylglycerol:prolipoprotein diacylglycerol transferase